MDPCCLALFPVRQTPDIFAEVGWHAFNSISTPEHMTMLRYFEQSFKMDLISISISGYGYGRDDPCFVGGALSYSSPQDDPQGRCEYTRRLAAASEPGLRCIR